MRIANAAAAPAAATSEESLCLIPATPVLVAAAEEDALAELEALSVVEALVPVVVVLPSVLVAAEALVAVLVPVVVPVSVEEVELEVELALLEQTAAVGRSVTPPRAQRDLATFRVAVRGVSYVLRTYPHKMIVGPDGASRESHTLLICRGALIGNTAGDIAKE
jgi:hypothetical protein